jgi:hypothetical protein
VRFQDDSWASPATSSFQHARACAAKMLRRGFFFLFMPQNFVWHFLEACRTIENSFFFTPYSLAAVGDALMVILFRVTTGRKVTSREARSGTPNYPRFIHRTGLNTRLRSTPTRHPSAKEEATGGGSPKHPTQPRGEREDKSAPHPHHRSFPAARSMTSFILIALGAQFVS